MSCCRIVTLAPSLDFPSQSNSNWYSHHKASPTCHHNKDDDDSNSGCGVYQGSSNDDNNDDTFGVSGYVTVENFASCEDEDVGFKVKHCSRVFLGLIARFPCGVNQLNILNLLCSFLNFPSSEYWLYLWILKWQDQPTLWHTPDWTSNCQQRQIDQDPQNIIEHPQGNRLSQNFNGEKKTKSPATQMWRKIYLNPYSLVIHKCNNIHTKQFITTEH